LAFGVACCARPAVCVAAGRRLLTLVIPKTVAPVGLAPRALSLPLAFAPAIAFGAGTALAPASPLVGADPRRASLVLLFAVVTVHWLVKRMLYGRALKADNALAAAHREAHDQYVILSENVDRREQDRLVHDTILNTLTAIARSGGTPAAVSQCRQDIALLESALGESGGAAAAGRPAGGPVAATEALVGQVR